MRVLIFNARTSVRSRTNADGIESGSSASPPALESQNDSKMRHPAPGEETKDQSKGAPLADRHQPILIAWIRGVDGGSGTACAGPVIGNMM